jgi:AraC family transcriptional regulator
MPAKKKTGLIKKTIQVRNMISTCCITLLRKELSADGIRIHDLKLGKLALSYDPDKITWEAIVNILEENGFGIIEDKEKIMVEQIRLAVIDLVHHSTYNAMVRNSDYLVERFNMSYPYLSSLFSRHENTTLEKFIILHKIEKVKELIDYGELSLSEIAFMMGYSSVQYLSTQFRNITGISVSEYKTDPSVTRKPLDTI